MLVLLLTLCELYIFNVKNSANVGLTSNDQGTMSLSNLVGRPNVTLIHVHMTGLCRGNGVDSGPHTEMYDHVPTVQVASSSVYDCFMYYDGKNVQ